MPLSHSRELTVQLPGVSETGGDATITALKVQDQRVKDTMWVNSHQHSPDCVQRSTCNVGPSRHLIFPPEVRHLNLPEGVSCFRLCNQR